MPMIKSLRGRSPGRYRDSLGCEEGAIYVKKTRKLHVKHRYRRSHVKNGVKKEVSKSPSRALPEAGASGPLRL